MQFGTIRGLLLLLMMGTTVSSAAQNPAVTGDGGCRQIAGQLPHTASTFGHGLAAAPRNSIRPSNLQWKLPIARFHPKCQTAAGTEPELDVPPLGSAGAFLPRDSR